MRITLLCFSLIFISKFTDAQIIKYSLDHFHYCPAGDLKPYRYVPPINNRFNIIKRSLNFNVTYDGIVPQKAKDAIENSVLPILDDILNSNVPININVKYEMRDPSNLAAAFPTSYFSGFRNAPKIDVAYPVVLAEKISKIEINDPSEPDIQVLINANQDWYYDYNIPSGIGNRYDFVSTVLHEILHGMGFNASTFVNADEGFARIFENDIYSIYTDKIINSFKLRIVDEEEGSLVLKQLLTSNNLFFNSYLEDYKIYAPFEYSPGSSISHLDQIRYSNTDDALMTPFGARGEVIHSLGASQEILYDLGWSMIYFDHFPEMMQSESNIDEDKYFGVRVSSDFPIDSASLNFVYSFDNFVSDTSSISLNHIVNDSFNVLLPAPGENAILSYFFEGEDINNRYYSNPGLTQNDNHTFFEYVYGADPYPPEIKHNPITTISQGTNTIEINASISDNFTGINSARVEWRINQGLIQSIIMVRDEENQFDERAYKGLIAMNSSDIIPENLLEYRIIAEDKSSITNSQSSPENQGFYSISIVDVVDPVYSYVNDFDLTTNDFLGDFTIDRPIGFATPLLNSPHPYPEAGEMNTLNMIAELKVPIIVVYDYPIIEFDEVVLVEPGDPGTTWGDQKFWDYVIVEAKTQISGSWEPLLDGYDSGYRTSWSNRFNSILNGGTSLAVGGLTLLENRIIDITSTGKYNPGDTIQIRFRLFSDPFAVGWGWAIDNLKIQDQSTSNKNVIEDNLVDIYPNPVSNRIIYVSIKTTENVNGFISVYDSSGRLISQDRIIKEFFSLRLPDPEGVYFVKITSDDKSLTKRIIRI